MAISEKTGEQTVDFGEPVLLTEQHDRALVMSFNRPHARNAIDLEVTNRVADALDRLDRDDSVTVGILTGVGGYFSAGMDLGAFMRGEPPWHPVRGFGGIIERASEKPLIAAIEGFAVAGGLEIALACDLVVAARGAQLGIPEVKRGLAAVGGGLVRLGRRLPYHVAMELALTGELMTAEELHGHGLVNRLAAPGAALECALELAASIAANGPLGLTASKYVLERQHDWDASEMWKQQAEIKDRLLNSEDAREGALAFKERRAPVWSGR
jgi:enoyl-CoA hydratase